jgi:bacteriocin biosynthesis cyclodehydratase domain-containing protein
VADSVRLTTAARPPGLIGVGEFGKRVTRLLAAWIPAAREYEAADGLSAAFAPAAGAVVLALWRPDPRLCERADELSFRNQVAWLPVIAEHPVIRVGPFVDPATGPCFRCYARRRAQHDRQPWVTAALRAGYQADENWGPAGYLPHHARMASAVALQALSERALAPGPPARSRAGGEVTTIGAAVSGLQANPVITCHNCDRCPPAAPQRPAGPDWLSALAASLPAAAADLSPAGSRPGSGPISFPTT